jgi:hypothetical protein
VNALLAALLLVQDTAAVPVRKPTSDFWRPLASVAIPGIGQLSDGAPLAAAGFMGSALLGYGLYLKGDTSDASLSDLPRSPRGQQSLAGLEIATAAGFLSAYDAFHRQVPSLQLQGKYTFLTAHEPLGRVMLAPFDPSMLKRWTTWVDLAHTAVITTILVATETKPGKRYLPFRAHDAAFAGTLSYGAGTGEEGAFRGWLYPMLYQRLGRHWVLADGIQAALFGSLHLPQAGAFAADIAVWGFYEGWLTRRNGWSVRESEFHHFWYDAIIFTATFLTQGAATIRVTVPGVRF